MTSTAMYFRKIGDGVFEPAFNSFRDYIRHRNPNDKFCKVCNSIVGTEHKVDARGMIEICPFCLSEDLPIDFWKRV